MNKLEYLLDISDYFVAFVRVAVTGVPENISLPKDFNWEALYSLAERHKLTAAVWRGIQLTEFKVVPTSLSEKWFVRTQQILSKSIRFDHEISRIQTLFDQYGIDYIIIKGVTLQKYWPEKGLREFSDHDILIREEQRETARDIMLSLGYTNSHFGSVHDVYQKEPIYNVEIHVRLFESDYAYSDYFTHIWDRAVPVLDNSHQFQLTRIDFYLYFLFHFAKHTQCDGSGVRFYTDLFLLRKQLSFTPEEEENVNRVLVQYGQFDQIQKIYANLDYLFSHNGEMSSQTKELIFSGSTYGSHTHRIYNSVRANGKWKYVFARLFPPRKVLINRFKILRPMPFLLPFVWIYRLIHHLFSDFHRRRIQTEIRDVRRFSDKEVK